VNATIFNIETEFLQGNLGEEIYMDALPSLGVNNIQKVSPRKIIYGLVQSASEFFKKLIEVFKVIDFFGSKSDSYLRTKYESNVKNIVMISLYVENFLVIGKQKIISKLIEELKTHELKLMLKEKVVY
jgi:hypothetical protein